MAVTSAIVRYFNNGIIYSCRWTFLLPFFNNRNGPWEQWVDCYRYRASYFICDLLKTLIGTLDPFKTKAVNRLVKVLRVGRKRFTVLHFNVFYIFWSFVGITQSELLKKRLLPNQGWLNSSARYITVHKQNISNQSTILVCFLLPKYLFL